MHIGVGINNNTGIQKILGIKDVFDLPHQLVCIGTPFHLDIRSHIATGTMLCFQGAIIFFDHHPADIVHKATVAIHFFWVGKILGENEMQVALTGMAENDGFIIVVGSHQALKLYSSICQVVNGKGNIFNNDAGADLSHRTHSREQSLTNIPQLGIFGHFIGKCDRALGGKMRQRMLDRFDITLQLLTRMRPGLYQQSSGFL